jgi:hypothetical protein
VGSGEGGSEEFEPGVARLTSQDREQRRSLLVASPLIDKRLNFAVALVERPPATGRLLPS